MGAIPMTPKFDYVEGQVKAKDPEIEWIRPTVGGTLLVGSLLLLTGRRKAGLVVAAAGAALALLEEQDALRAWWNAMPRYLEDAQRLLDQAQSTVEDLSQKREKLRAIIGR